MSTALTDYSRDFFKITRAAARALRGDQVSVSLFVELLDRARYVAGPIIHEGQVLHLEVGECVMGRDEIGAKISASAAQVRAAKKRLEQLQLIASRTTNRGTVVTVLGYGEIAVAGPADSPADQPAHDQQTASRQPADSQQTSRRTATNKKQRQQRRRNEETSSAGSLAERAAPSSPAAGGFLPPPGGKAEQEAERRIAAGELGADDVTACWSYCDRAGIRTDAAAARAIARQRPARAAIADRVEPSLDGDAYRTAPWG